jgi:hypothetical protein
MLFAHKSMKSLIKNFFVKKIVQEKNSVCVFWQAAGADNQSKMKPPNPASCIIMCFIIIDNNNSNSY